MKHKILSQCCFNVEHAGIYRDSMDSSQVLELLKSLEDMDPPSPTLGDMDHPVPQPWGSWTTPPFSSGEQRPPRRWAKITLLSGWMGHQNKRVTKQKYFLVILLTVPDWWIKRYQIWSRTDTECLQDMIQQDHSAKWYIYHITYFVVIWHRLLYLLRASATFHIVSLQNKNLNKVNNRFTFRVHLCDNRIIMVTWSLWSNSLSVKVIDVNV